MARAAVRPISTHERVEHDFYAESPWAAAAVFEVERFAGAIWDPACGLCTIPAAARAAGFAAYGTDIVRRSPSCISVVDFLDPDAVERKCAGRWPFDNIVANPPFALSQKFAERALELARHKVAFLLPLAFLEGDKRTPWLETTPLARVWVSRRRVGLRPAGEALKTDGGTKAFGWFIWEHGWRGPAQIRWFDKPKAAA